MNQELILCYACDKPPLSNQKLRKCHNCQWAWYHDADCQRKDWKQHRRVCATMAAIAKPLHREMEQVGGGEPWWERLSLSDQHQHELCWKQGYQIWCETKEYLLAVDYFQQSLAVCQIIWNEYLQNPTPQEKNITDETPKSSNQCNVDSVPFAFRLAQRLLFCAYCEMDGQAIDAARQRLLQGISILFQTKSSWNDKEEQRQQQDWNDLCQECGLVGPC